MAESALTTAVANALSGTTDSDTDGVYPTTGESTYYTTVYRLLNRILKAVELSNELRVYKDGDLTYGVRAGKASHGTNVYSYAGCSSQSVEANDTEYVWLEVQSEALVLNTSIGASAAFPDPSETAHIPLATIEAGASSFDHEDITDYRGRAIFELIG